MGSDERMGPADAGRGPGQQPPAQSWHSLTRQARYDEYRQMYLGDQWLSEPVPGERRLTVNYARVFVNKAASYLLGKPIGYNAQPLGAVGASTEQREAAERLIEDFLAEVGAFNDLGSVDLDAAITSGLLGDGAFTVRWDAGAGMPRVTAVDPGAIEARWRADDLRTLLWVRQSYYAMPAELTEEQVGRLGEPRPDTYASLAASEEWTPERWRLTVAGEEVDGGTNPYGVIPYVLYPNLRVPGEFWGESDLADLVELQRELNERVSIFSRILHVAGNPVAVITGADEEDTAALSLGPNKLWTLPNPESRAEVLDLLKSGGAEAHLRFIDLLYRAMHDISEMPRTSFGDSSGSSQARSGAALEIELQPLLHKLARKQALLSGAFERRAQLVLAVARVHGKKLPECRVSCIWPPVLPQDRQALVSQEVSLVNAGIHAPTQALSLLGASDPEPMFEKVIAEGKQLQEAGLKGPLTPRPPLPFKGRGGE